METSSLACRAVCRLSEQCNEDLPYEPSRTWVLPGAMISLLITAVHKKGDNADVRRYCPITDMLSPTLR